MLRFAVVCIMFFATSIFVFGQNRFYEGSRSKAFSRKNVIDSTAIANWFSLDGGMAISYEGDYVSYHIKNYPVGDVTTIVKSANGNWKKELVGVKGVQFSGDSKKVIYFKDGKLYLLPLGKDVPDSINGVRSFKIAKSKKVEWLAYMLNGNDQEVVLLNLFSGKEQRWKKVTEYMFNTDYALDSDITTGNIQAKVLLLVKEAGGEFITGKNIEWVQIDDDRSYEIWTSSEPSKIRGIQFDTRAEQIVFTVEKKDGNSIWYYKKGMDEAQVKVTNQSLGIEEGLSVKGSAHFSSNGKWIFFLLSDPSNNNEPLHDGVKVNVWSYKDAVLQPEQLAKEGAISNTYVYGPGVKRYLAAIGTHGNNVVRIERENERVLVSAKQISADYVVIQDHDFVIDTWWSLSPKPSVYLVSLNNGSRHLLMKENRLLTNFTFSPDGKKMLYYDLLKGNYFSVDLETFDIRDVTKSVPESVFESYIKNIYKSPVATVAGWLETGDVLIYDNFDIWKIDISGKRNPVCITDGYGKKNHVKLRLITEDPNGKHLIKLKESILLIGLNEVNKNNGFFKLRVDQRGGPESLYIGPYTFYHKRSQVSNCYELNEGRAPVKAGGKEVWVIERQSAIEAPNFFITNDFKSFRKLTDVQPQEGYNWLKTELITYKMMDGNTSQGILYKPENFDSTKKYPIIFNYYEKLSHRLFEFPAPSFSTDNINIPYFVSRGYLVFTPDIYYKPANISGKVVGEWVYNSVVAAASYLATFPYIEATKMGIQGHSFGGLETNYLVTHTNIFAAAMTAAGATDPISEYLTLTPFLGDDKNIEDHSTQNKMENNHELYGATPWERPELYSKNSAVLNAHKVVTPLLIMHNKLDDQIQWRQGIELYMGLRRLHKSVWLLTYDNGYHTVFGKDAIDYTIRINQFFDHYLKDSAAPIWMTRGIPARLKDFTRGYSLDLNLSCAKGCKVCRKHTQMAQGNKSVFK